MYVYVCICKANSKFSTQLCLPDDFTCVLDDSGGILLADKSIQAFQASSIQFHVILCSLVHVIVVDEDDAAVVVVLIVVLLLFYVYLACICSSRW